MNSIELCKEMGIYFDGKIKNFPTEKSFQSGSYIYSDNPGAGSEPVPGFR
ncbi:MAG: hypothetical protein ACOYEG_02450 [Petrimonas sp.]|jgi:hypothetical protein